MNRTRNLIIILIGVILVIAGALVIARRNAQTTLAVNIVTVKRATFSVKLPETGVVMNPATVTIPTLVAGNIRDIYVRAGEHVNAGALLASIENPTLDYNAAGSQADYINAVANVKTARVQEQNARVQYQAQVDTNKSALDEARRVYEADVALVAQKAIPQNQVDADKAKLDQAQVAYDQAVAQLKLGAVSGYGMDSVQAAQANAEKSKILNAQNQQQVAFTRIVAPMSGIVQTVATQSSDALRSLQPGDAVTAGQSLFTLASDQGYIVKAQVDEQDIFNVRVGQHAVVSSEDFPGKSIVGHVRSIAPVAVKSTDPSSTAKQVLVTVALDRTPAYLKDGLTVDVDIYTTQTPNVIAIPTDAIHKEGTKAFVYVVRKGLAAKTYVTTSQTNDTQTLITSGLAAGDLLIDDKNTALIAGSPVKAAPSPSASPGGGSGGIIVGG